MLSSFHVGYDDFPPGNGRNYTGNQGQDHLAAVPSYPAFNAGSDEWRLGTEQGHGLPLHVRTHQRPVGVVVFQEGYQGRRHTHDLHGRHVHQIHRVGGILHVFLTHPEFDPVVGKLIQVV